MSGVWLVARREVVTRGRSRSFLIGLVVSVVIIAGLAVIPQLFDDGDPSYTVGLVGAESLALRPALTDLAAADEVALHLTELPDEDAARAAVTDGEADAAVLDGHSVLVDVGVDAHLDQLLDNAHRLVRTEQRLRAEGLDPGQVADALAVPPLAEVPVGASAEDTAIRLGLAVVVVLLMFMLIYVPAVYVAMGVVEEKSSRVVELLLAAVRPWQLLTGKIIGIGLLSFLHLAVIAGAGIGIAAATGLTVELPAGTGGIIAGTFVWFLLGYAFFASVAAAAGSLISRQEDINGVLTPIMLLMMVAYVGGFLAVFNPGTTIANVLSIAPPFSAIVMPVRTAASVVPVWQIAVALLLMAVAAAAVLALGARIYERAVLRTGARVRLREVLTGGRPTT